MAADDLKDTLSFIKGGEYGSFPGRGPDPRTIARRARSERLPDDIKNGGYSVEFLDRIASLEED